MCACANVKAYTGLSNDVYAYKFMYIKSVSSFVESVHCLNACMCCVCACVCVCVSQCMCCIYVLKHRPMCVHVAKFRPIYRLK